VATYFAEWKIVAADQPGISRVNPETLPSTTSPDFSFRYIDIGSVGRGTIDWDAVQTLRFADAPSRARRVVRPGDVLLCTVRPLLGSHTSANWKEQEGYVCSTGFAVIRDDGLLNPDFLKHLPFCEQVTRQLIAWQCGTNYPAVNENDVRRLRLPLPPLVEQEAIARILDAADLAINKTREAIHRAQQLDHSLLHELLEHGLDPSRKKAKVSWPLRRVDEVAVVGSGITLGKDVSGFKNVEMPYLRVANVQDGHLDLTEIKTVRVRVEDVDGYRLQAGDVLMTEGGDIDKLGRGTLWHGEILGCLHQNHIFRVRANPGSLESEFFSLIVESDIAKRYFLRVAKRTTNLASINKTQLRAFQFPVPTIEEQLQIIAVMKAIKATLTGFEEKAESLIALKKALLGDLLTGRVRVNTIRPRSVEVA
jgi:type I restriction enzyme S subunit